MAFIRKKQMLKPCYTDTESQFNVTARTATGNGQVN